MDERLGHILRILLDGHSSHYCPETIHLAAEEDVIIFTLPPNTTHLTQPLDKGVFGPFKDHWRQVCHDFQVSHPGKVVSNYNFSKLFSKAWMESMTCTNIVAGFHTTGIFPVNREKELGSSVHLSRNKGECLLKICVYVHVANMWTVL